MSRITAADVKVAMNGTELDGTRHVMALVTGRNRTFVVDYYPRNWGDDWLCTCGKAPACTHIRAVKAVVGL